jgi:hypothetical protein
MTVKRQEMNTRRRMWAALVLVSVLAVPMVAQTARKPSSEGDLSTAEFFIISSVDLGKKQILLKRPTEVTELMQVQDDTRFFEENQKPLKLTDLRAGDTVYITSRRNGEQSIALIIRKGPMTLETLRERYLKK